MSRKSTLTLAVVAGTLGLPMTVQEAAAAFIEDSKASLTFKNFYINQDDRDQDRARSEEWGQGFLFDFKSGFTEGPIGFGLDLIAQEAIRLDGGGRSGKSGIDRSPGSVFPLESNGKGKTDFGRLNGTGKIRISNTVAELGVLRPKLPVVVTNDGRLLPQLYHGGQITSKEFKDLTFVVGKLEHSTERNSSDNYGLSIAGANSLTSGKFSNKFYYGGVDYKVTKDLMLQYYFGNLEDFYEQHFFGVVHNWELPAGKLKTDLRYWTSDSSGANSRASGRAEGYRSAGYWSAGDSNSGEVDNDLWSALFTYTLGGHELKAGYQKSTGDSDFPVLNQGGYSVPLITDAMTEKFTRVGERVWLAGYAYDFAGLGIPGLKSSLTYYSGDEVDTSSDEKEEWERDFRVDYVVPTGTLKGLGLTWRSTAVRGIRERDDNRLYVTYTWNLL
ncbi:outer membrane porin, OprE-like protein [Azotobacter vinelandii CA]|uniref:Outer membrane porin, OprE-like protein n=2 Tax=Azotobacter vinelandii TaxID=354 RepID=C1DED4_AZOVD|nr:OprD family outer membrane porin [Azotobacter vinelandii]ACO78119.1 outer membrane porin, OprE-like protein [Azotobacter vinelandii DJ]AGK15122.1 outer membrane porin, OprE-like protein [Azotobacter vinelandii CA]AGK20271.1 outer membrane porin, OprE-like protein [Azotobacter vinelandii CA6]WKN23829.1 OprD family porin [Azotobacter vinelandii]SFY00961.1 outer membrane porin, OprD family [Azotobacter vinelandii]